ncbi:TPA: hypothetical protein L4Q92_004933 [Pseudomonas aeruginosa]|nr:hypothetical protein [Pseudomonas aeruginosa]
MKLKPGHLLTLRFEFGAARLNALEWGICREHVKIQVDAAKAEIVADAKDGVFGVRQRRMFGRGTPVQALNTMC